MPKPSTDAGLRVPALDDLQPEERAEASQARRYIRVNFDAVTAARERGVSWQQITGAMAAVGVLGMNNEPLGWRQLKSLFHTERYARGGKRKRRKAQPRAVQTAAPPAAAAPEPARPAPVTARSVPQEAPPVPEPPALPVADPEVARRLNNLRTIEEVPPMALPAGWRKRKGNDDG